jgi:sugar-specific transcriptional regulator TrmB
MATPIRTLLKHIGLSEPEANVYIVSLRLGESGVSEIAHGAKISRTTTASILERLKERGFLSTHTTRGKKRYWIEDPHVLVEQGKAHLEVLELLAGRLHSEYHQADKKPTAQIFDSRDGLAHLLSKVIDDVDKGGEILTFESPSAKHYQAILADELFHALSKQKVKKGIRTRSLIPTGQESFIRPEALKHNVQVRTLPQGVLVESSFWMFGNTLVLFSGTHTFAVRINHRHMKESMTNLFEMAWSLSTPLG